MLVTAQISPTPLCRIVSNTPEMSIHKIHSTVILLLLTTSGGLLKSNHGRAELFMPSGVIGFPVRNLKDLHMFSYAGLPGLHYKFAQY